MNERVEALASAAIREEPLAEALGVAFGLGILLARLIDGDIGQAQHDASDHSQRQR